MIMRKVAMTTMAMGGWKWGYPKGHRYGITVYKPHKCKNGKWVWKSGAQLCDGLTAANEPFYKHLYPEAFENYGGCHNKPLSVEELRKFNLQKLLETT